jgi:hypothetical protein
MRINTAWHDNAIPRIHQARAGGNWQATRRGNSDNLFPCDGDFCRAYGVGRDNAVAPDDKIHSNIPIWRMVARQG